MAENSIPEKYAYLDQLSTKELQEILRADVDSPSGGDDEAIFYILEVMEKREHEHPSGSFPDVDNCWREFQTIYHTPEGEGQSLYPVEEIGNVRGESSTGKNSGNTHKNTRRVTIAVAVIVLLIVSLTVPVAGYANFFEMIGNWSAEQFSFINRGKEQPEASGDSDNASISDEVAGAELQQVLTEYGIQEKIVPQWMPDGFEINGKVSMTELSDFGETSFFASYSNHENYIVFDILVHQNWNKSALYEKTEDIPEPYLSGGIEHYIIRNTDTLTAAWYAGNIECSISTTLVESDLKRVIDSIYWE